MKGIESLKNYDAAISLFALEARTALGIGQPHVASHLVTILVNRHLRTASVQFNNWTNQIYKFFYVKYVNHFNYPVPAIRRSFVQVICMHW